ncbi:MAG: hypothetical protein HYW89_02185 [Candidatus Sungiibacteriota bacterium]|uniref:Uncharacterized protein n=1 Tax=Candidatus Sungiibacteriota bacterium TaxID=2750080 RepID=A0A7T5RKC4_9BACT|nr:MAG: hypothetical protein HYW89_02185 [Candidatus Sungbacteria bacterium]
MPEKEFGQREGGLPSYDEGEEIQRLLGGPYREKFVPSEEIPDPNAAIPGQTEEKEERQKREWLFAEFSTLTEEMKTTIRKQLQEAIKARPDLDTFATAKFLIEGAVKQAEEEEEERKRKKGWKRSSRN